MKASISAVFSLLVSVAVARPHATEEGDTLRQTSRVTAFVVSPDGTPSIECWEITNMVDDQQIQCMDGSKGTGRAVQIAGGRELDGLDILTWPAYSPIWPIPDDASGEVRAEWFDLSATPSLFSIQGGLINFNLNFRFGRIGRTDDDDDEPLHHVFNLENGDDWFYFEDTYTGSDDAQKADAAPYPFTISTISASETEVMRLRFNNRPKHKVLHKGSCSFTGIRTPDSSSNRRSSYTKNALVKQHRNSDL